MTRRGAALLALLPLLLAALWVGPRLLDWEPHRARIEELASARLGRPVTLAGPIRLTLLPQPRLEAETVSIGGPGGGPGGGSAGEPAGPVAVTARFLFLRLDLGHLLGGRLAPRQVTLRGGELTLPWPPAEMPSLRPPPWLTELDARLESFALRLGGLRLEGLNAALVTGGAAEALAFTGRFAWRGGEVAFDAQLGRGGLDGAAPLDLTLTAAGARLAAVGVLDAAGGFEGRLEAAGPDLAALLPAPPGPFRAAGRLTAAAELLAAQDLTVELGGQAARGALTLRLLPDPRLDLALAAGRLDLEGWIAALRGARGFALPLGVDLSAEATALGGVALRRLRAGVFLDGERLSLTDVSALLPGDTEVELAGASAGARLELSVRFVGGAVRDSLAAFGLDVGDTDPARLRTAEGRFRLVLEKEQASVSDLVATVDGARLTGAAVLRRGARPSLGAGLAIDRLDLDGLLPVDLDAMLAGLPGWAAGVDLNLRLAAEAVTLRGWRAERTSLDLSLAEGRLALRRLGLRAAGLDVALAGAAQLSVAQPTRFADLMLEVGGSAAEVAPLLPRTWARLLPESGPPIAIRLSGAGVAGALGLRAEGDLGELRVESQMVLDLPARRGAGSLTLRHPGAPRLLATVLGPRAEEWLGEGSLALIATIAAHPGGATAEGIDLVAGGLRARGALAYAAATGPPGAEAGAAARPRLTGRIEAERLPLPPIAWRSPEPWPTAALDVIDVDVALSAAVLILTGGPTLQDLDGRVQLAAGQLTVAVARARLGGGRLTGTVRLDASAPPPRLAIDVTLEDAAIAGPLFDLPLDLSGGRVTGAARLTASGYGAAGLLGTLDGTAELSVRDGILVGIDAGAAAAAAARPDPAEAEAGLRAALGGAATAFERLSAGARVTEGRALLSDAVVSTDAGIAAATGTLDLARGAIDVRIGSRPVADAPEIGVRLTGPAATPRRVLEIAPLLRWRAERG